MFLTNPLAGEIALLDATVIAVLGYAVVFFGIILLMLVMIVMGRFFTGKQEKKSASTPAKAAAPAAPVAPAAPAAPVAEAPAPGSAGKLKLHNVPPKTAAMLMAIVADKMGKPLNELRFISIKEVK